MYNVKFIPFINIDKLASDWKRLQAGTDMTYFQRYEWYEMLVEKNRHVSHSCFELVFAVVERHGIAVLIAPLWIVKKTFGKYNKQGVYIFGRGQWSDYLNFIYDVFYADAVTCLLNTVKENTSLCDFCLEDIPASSQLYQYLKITFPERKEKCTKCVHLDVPKDKEEYHKLLSKSSRQNIRTAVNRANRDGVEFFFDFDDRNVNLTDFSKYRDVRVADKVRKYNGGVIRKVKLLISKHILHRGIYSFTPYFPFRDDKFAKFISVKDQKGNLCASFCYGVDEIHKRIVLMAVSTNPNFYKYSPGVLGLYNYILKQLCEHEIEVLDFTRGDEKYKYSLGGIEHYNYTVNLKL